jgi:ATP-dependent protease ClpP protease subunit
MSQKIEIYNQWIQEKVILINENITTDLAAKIVLNLKQLKNDANIKVINIYINSSGGDVYAMQMIIAEMERVKKIKEIHTHICSYAHSAAAIIALLGTFRTADRFAKILYHEVKISENDCTIHDIDSNKKALSDLNNICKEIILNNTRLTKEDIDKFFNNKDIYIDAKQALKYKIINKIE